MLGKSTPARGFGTSNCLNNTNGIQYLNNVNILFCDLQWCHFST